MGLIDDGDRIVSWTLAIKAASPTLDVLSLRLARILADAVAGAAAPLVAAALEDIAGAPSEAIVASRIGGLNRALTAAGLGDEVADELAAALAAAYRLGLDDIAASVGGRLDFGLPDQDALYGLRDAGVYWIRDRLGARVPVDAAPVLWRAVLEGGGYERVAERLREAFQAVEERDRAYWLGFAQTNLTRARSFGAISGLVRVGATHYQYVNPRDERTSPVCRALDGVVFEVRGAVALRDRLLDARTPEDWRTLSPWPGPGLLNAEGKPPPPAEMQAAGIAFPPLHFRCRSVIDIASAVALPDAPQAAGAVELGAPPLPGRPAIARKAAFFFGLPTEYLSPEGFGRRLRLLQETAPLGGTAAQDATGERWIVGPWRGDNARAAVTAAALYRACGVLSPAWRLVIWADELRAAAPAWRFWGPVLIAPELEADRWLAQVTPAQHLDRDLVYPGLPPILVANTGNCLGWRLGAYAASWAQDGYRAAADSAPARVSDATIRAAVAAAEWPESEADPLTATLIARLRD